MILCKYVDSKGCSDILTNRRLLATDPITFNDPFEVLPGITGTPDKNRTLTYLHSDLLPRLSAAVGTAVPGFNEKFVLRDEDSVWRKVAHELGPGLRREIENGLERASQSIRIICFCDPDRIKDEGDDVLLWSHYGDKHRGVRIYFQTDSIAIRSRNLFPVTYSPERPSIDITDPGEMVGKAEEAYRTTMRTKNKSWGYEGEVRWIINLRECKLENGRSYIPLEPIAVQRIDFGCNCDIDKIVPLLKGDDNPYQHVKRYMASIHEYKYALQYHEFDF
jgi:hypothetical protein